MSDDDNDQLVMIIITSCDLINKTTGVVGVRLINHSIDMHGLRAHLINQSSVRDYPNQSITKHDGVGARLINPSIDMQGLEAHLINQSKNMERPKLILINHSLDMQGLEAHLINQSKKRERPKLT